MDKIENKNESNEQELNEQINQLESFELDRKEVNNKFTVMLVYNIANFYFNFSLVNNLYI